MTNSGIINLDKPAGMSSARAVSQVKRLLPRGTKIGHAGTLDPFATGVLVLLIGRATRLCERFMSEPKQYVATVKLGAMTATLDPESPEEPTADPSVPPPTIEAVREALRKLTGEIRQRPPAFSALKIGGRPAYKLARAGRAPELAERTVHVYRIELIRYEWPLLELRIDCGRGTYIRSMARDVGELLSVGGGHLTHLRRTRVGPCAIEHAVSLEMLQAGVGPHLMKVEERIEDGG